MLHPAFVVKSSHGKHTQAWAWLRSDEPSFTNTGGAQVWPTGHLPAPEPKHSGQLRGVLLVLPKRLVSAVRSFSPSGCYREMGRC